MSKLTYGFLFLLAISLFSCKSDSNTKVNSNPNEIDPLPSFNMGESKGSIINFVSAITDESNPNYVKPEDRIVCFDNDGTLWVEQPLPNQVFFTFDRIKQLAEQNPELKKEQPFKAVIEDDQETMATFHSEDLIKLVGLADQTDNVESFNQIVQDWLKTAKHPHFNKPYKQLVYQPMLELLDYLRANDFKIYIVSGGSVEFMRAFADDFYGITTEQVIGSRMQLKTTGEGEDLQVERTPYLAHYDDREGKVISIEEIIGRKPIMVVGNSDGDLAMMEYAFDQEQKTLMVYLNHTDGEREFLYDDSILAGQLVEGKTVATKNHWTIIDMKKDWKVVFPEQ